MINSRDINDLYPEVRDRAFKLKALCTEKGIDIIFTSTYRDFESQNALYLQGRTPESKARGEKIVTNAKAGESFHNYRVAFDVVPVVNGKPVWGTSGADLKLWETIGSIGVDLGLEWAGNWKTFREFPHFQYTNGKTLDDLKKGL